MDVNPESFLQQISGMKHIATVLFALAVIHTFLCAKLRMLAHRYRPGSIGENLFHLLGEVEVVFGMWAAVLVGIWSVRYGSADAVHFLEDVNFTEAMFVFVIMCIAATRPILYLAENAVLRIARLIPGPGVVLNYVVILTLGPCLGSFITEPAAMTVCALLLRPLIFERQVSQTLRYATLGLLFVNISIGGTLTHFAAPPVLMVAGPWKWDSIFMLTHFGWRAVIAVCISTGLTVAIFFKELAKLESVESSTSDGRTMPLWMILSHLIFLGFVIYHSHHPAFFCPLFLLFLGWYEVTKEYQVTLRLRESLLVGYFLGGLVVLGKLQDWWLQPILGQLSPFELFCGTTALTAITDNAALTYLGTLVSSLSDSARYSLVAGAVTGGGLTVIANAPNPAGFGILNQTFGEGGIRPLWLLVGALPSTLVAAFFFLL